MKKIVKIISLTCAFALVLCLASCKSAAEKQANESYERAAAAFAEAASLIRENGTLVSGETAETVAVLEEIFESYGKKLHEEELSDEKYNEMNEWFSRVEKWADKAKAELSAVVG